MANSYIVSSSGNYCFSTKFIGNGSAPSGWTGIDFNRYPTLSSRDGAYAYWVYGDDVEIILNQNDCISDVFYSSDKIYFKATGNKGNAKVTLKNNGERIWTWHIWCTDTPGTYTFNSFTVMDRNLGAYGSVKENGEASCGLYYPFGSPIGFTIYEYSEGVSSRDVSASSMQDAFARHPERPYLLDAVKYRMFNDNNNNDVWLKIWGSGGSKTMFDPCPPGYKVTPKAFWDGITITKGAYGYFAYNSSNSYTWDYSTGCILFPMNGYLYSGWYTDYGNRSKRGIRVESLSLEFSWGTWSGNTFTNESTVCMWTANSYGDNAYRYKAVRSRATDSSPGSEPSGGVAYDILTWGMGVRCVAE